MPKSIKLVTREFSPKETEAVIGVSVTMQRDWRRRGLLPQRKEEGWAKYKLEDVIEMMVMQLFSESRYSVKAAQEFAPLAIDPTLFAISKFPGSVDFEGDAIGKEEQDFYKARWLRGGRGRYLVIAHDRRAHKPEISQMENLKYIDEFLAGCDAIHATIIDCQRIAKTIVDRAGLPLVRFEVDEADVAKAQPRDE